MNTELALAKNEIGLNMEQLWKCQLNAAQATFLPDDEKAALVDQIQRAKPQDLTAVQNGN